MTADLLAEVLLPSSGWPGPTGEALTLLGAIGSTLLALAVIAALPMALSRLGTLAAGRGRQRPRR